MPDDVRIRAATTDDWSTYRDVRLAALRTDPSVFGSKYEDAVLFTEAQWRDRVALADGATFLALAGAACVGTAMGAPWHDDDGEPLADVLGLFGMWVDPAWRGRGVGTRLVDAVVGFAREGRWPVVQLLVSEEASGPRRLYERCGFVDTGERLAIRDEPGAWIGVVMRRPA